MLQKLGQARVWWPLSWFVYKLDPFCRSALNVSLLRQFLAFLISRRSKDKFSCTIRNLDATLSSLDGCRCQQLCNRAGNHFQSSFRLHITWFYRWLIPECDPSTSPSLRGKIYNRTGKKGNPRLIWSKKVEVLQTVRYFSRKTRTYLYKSSYLFWALVDQRFQGSCAP